MAGGAADRDLLDDFQERYRVVIASIVLAGPLAGENPIAGQGVVWVANILMHVMVWLGLRLRGQGWAHAGQTA